MYRYSDRHLSARTESWLAHPIWLRVRYCPSRLFIFPTLTVPTATVENSTSNYAESSTAALVSRDDDPMTVALRTKDSHIDLDEIVRLNRAASSSHHTDSTVGTLTTSVFSSHKGSSGTKQTSAGTSYPIFGQGNVVATYSSSLSASHGSVSDTEEKNQAFIGIGEWTGMNPIKGAVRSRKRQQADRLPKYKKPVVIIQHDGPYPASSDEDQYLTTENLSPRRSKETQYLLRHTTKVGRGRLTLAEEDLASQITEKPRVAQQHLTRARIYLLAALSIATVLTFSLSTFTVYSTGKAHIAYIKAIIFSATVLISVFTILAMIVGRRNLQEALQAGLLVFLIGFALVVEIREFV
jgi:hypothetical protein